MKYLPLLLVLLLLASCVEKKPGPQKPNVVIIFTDDQGYSDVGVFGAEGFETPNLDQMAQEGTLLTNFYVAQAVCSASRAALLTGCYPNRVGVHGAFMPNRGKGLALSEVTIAEMLKDNGYATAHYGKWHLGDHPKFLPNNQGFDDFFGIPHSNDMWPLHPQQGTVFDFDILPLLENGVVIDTLTDQSMLTTQITERSVEFIESHKEEPFFLYVAHPQPHVPLFVSDKFKGKSEKGLYGDVIMEIDWSVGEILKALKDSGIEENTMVIFTSDNGPWLNYGTHAGSADPFREGKGTSWEGGVREPFIIWWPGTIDSGRVIDSPVMSIDLMPTIAHLTKAQLPTNKIDGKNVWNILSGKSKENPHLAYFFYYNTNELQAVRYKNWKLYFPHRYRTLNGREGGTDGLPVDYDHNILESIELYDLSSDPEEQFNIAVKHPAVVDTIKALANEMRNELGDALTGVAGNENRPIGTLED
jgi:arylsulfatase